MTTIGSTSYQATSNRYTGAARSSGQDKMSDAFEAIASQKPSAKPAALAEGDQAAGNTHSWTDGFKVSGTQFSIRDLSNAKPLNIAEWSEEAYQDYVKGEEGYLESSMRGLEMNHSDWARASQSIEESLKIFPVSPTSQPYADVISGGRVVATISNGGVATFYDDVADRVRGKLSESANGKDGPAMAQLRAKEIASIVGGKIRMADTAMTQSQYDAQPPYERAPPVIDHDAVKKDPHYQFLQNMSDNLEKLKQARKEYLAKL